MSNTLAKAQFWIKRQAIAINESQRNGLNRLSGAGPGGFEGGINTRQYMTTNAKPRED